MLVGAKFEEKILNKGEVFDNNLLIYFRRCVESGELVLWVKSLILASYVIHCFLVCFPFEVLL